LERSEAFIRSLGGDEETRAYLAANRQAVLGAVNGVGPDAQKAVPETGVHAVANMPSVYVPSFVAASRKDPSSAYKNAYDLCKVGEQRERVDASLPLQPGQDASDIYFCAVDLNGTGVRFYGDVSFVLKTVPEDTVVLDRNSYDLDRSPIRERIPQDANAKAARDIEATKLAGKWAPDLQHMIVIKVLLAAHRGARRLTTGAISEAILNDEDYIEVLHQGSFGLPSLLEARMLAADAASDSQTAERMRRGPAPSLDAQIWRRRRRFAERALSEAGLRTVVVTTPGRVKL
jgi:hypothetical protein